MVYSSSLRQAVGAVRSGLGSIGLGSQDARFALHGEHAASTDAPLVLVACSGGRDSMALAFVSQKVCASLGVRCGAIIIDHRLQLGSSDAARTAAMQCGRLGLSPVIRVEVDVDVSRAGEEAGAREARYQALSDVATWFGAAAVLLAHTLDDQAETVLIDLMRSSGVSALTGMSDVIDWNGVTFARPFLGLTREQTTAVCRDCKIAWWDDPTNGAGMSPDAPLPQGYPLRSRVRHTVMPFLERFAGGGVARHLAYGTKSARQDEDFLNACCDEAYSHIVRCDAKGGLLIDASALQTRHAAIRSRVVMHALNELGIAFTSAHVDLIVNLATHWHGQGEVSLPSGYSAKRKKHVIRVCKNGTHANR